MTRYRVVPSFNLSVLIALLLTLAVLIGTAHASNPCTPFTVSHKRIIVPVMVNGKGPYPFLLDTGSTMTMIDRSIAKEVNAPLHGDVSISGIGKHKWAQATTVDSVTVGKFADHRLTVVVFDFQGTEAYQLDTVKTLGVLGNDVFLDMGFVNLDYTTMCLAVRQ